ncbi:hypothetical protein [Histidinibacterium aquaticum]|uniref:Uncharacterized protein n=1 Tax=Histidinibacterium aquaticum TaxID=2613962 RepID=A0A5J5GNQ9_9RHOB|nr:hypothetical protein [Histidinibacterium aquaticum]KAA9010016.1 hypothetical protein F3S47_01805 [Histidinibacterium aquaticum]
MVDAALPPAFKDHADDLHIILNGEVYSDIVQIAGDGERKTVRATITIDDPAVDRALVGIAQAPLELTPATADERLRRLGYELEITLEEVDYCDISLFQQFTNPRLARVSGNVAADGTVSLPWLSQELGPRTHSTIALSSTWRSVAEGVVCVDHLAATQSRRPVISIYTPSPLTLMGGGFAGLTVEHDGWGGWPADSSFKLTVVLPDVTVGDLREGRTYRAVLPGMMAEGFSSIYTDYEGSFTGPGPSDFEGRSNVLVAKGAQGIFAVEEAAAGFLSGELTITGPAEFITWEHSQLSDGRYQMDGEDMQGSLIISGNIMIEATEDSLRLIREGGQVKTTVID